MANQGEKIFSSRGKRVQKMTFEPVPKGEYTGKLLGSTASKGCKTDPGSVPYIRVRFELENTAKEGGKNKLLFHMLFTSLHPAANGFVMVEKGGQAVDLANALGEELAIPTITMEANVKVGGTKDSPEYELKEIEILDPDALVQWLRDHDGATLRINVGVRKGIKGDDENVVNFFVYDEDSVRADADSSVETTNPFASETEEEEEAEVTPPAKVTAIKKAVPAPAKKVSGKKR